MDKYRHIGNMIKDEAIRQHYSPMQMAMKVNTTVSNLHNIYRRPSVDIDLLWRFCKALNKNFFRELAIDFSYGSEQRTSEGISEEVPEEKETGYKG